MNPTQQIPTNQEKIGAMYDEDLREEFKEQEDYYDFLKRPYMPVYKRETYKSDEEHVAALAEHNREVAEAKRYLYQLIDEMNKRWL